MFHGYVGMTCPYVTFACNLKITCDCNDIMYVIIKQEGHDGPESLT